MDLSRNIQILSFFGKRRDRWSDKTFVLHYWSSIVDVIERLKLLHPNSGSSTFE